MPYHHSVWFCFIQRVHKLNGDKRHLLVSRFTGAYIVIDEAKSLVGCQHSQPRVKRGSFQIRFCNDHCQIILARKVTHRRRFPVTHLLCPFCSQVTNGNVETMEPISGEDKVRRGDTVSDPVDDRLVKGRHERPRNISKRYHFWPVPIQE